MDSDFIIAGTMFGVILVISLGGILWDEVIKPRMKKGSANDGK